MDHPTVTLISLLFLLLSHLFSVAKLLRLLGERLGSSLASVLADLFGECGVASFYHFLELPMLLCHDRFVQFDSESTQFDEEGHVLSQILH